MLSTICHVASEIRDHEGFLWNGRFGSLYLKLWKPTFSAFYLRRVGDDKYAGPLVGFRVGRMPEYGLYGLYGLQATAGRHHLTAGMSDKLARIVVRTPMGNWRKGWAF